MSPEIIYFLKFCGSLVSTGPGDMSTLHPASPPPLALALDLIFDMSVRNSDRELSRVSPVNRGIF